MADADTRWLQRFENLKRALLVLQRDEQLARERERSELEQQGIENIIGSRDAFRLGFQNGTISEGDIWMDMIRARNPSSPTDNLEQARAIVHDVIQRFAPAAPLRCGLPEAAITAKHQVLATNREVEEAILYDSRAMGRHRPASDIDLTLIGPRLTSHALARIDADLDDLLLPWVIDLSSLSAISHEPLLEHIRRVGQVLYPRDPAQPSRLISSAAARPGN